MKNATLDVIASFMLCICEKRRKLTLHFMKLQSISIQTLIYEAYSRYGSLTIGGIERLRLKHRLRVVQSLEDGIEKNVIRSVLAEKYMALEELQVHKCIYLVEMFLQPNLFF